MYDYEYLSIQEARNYGILATELTDAQLLDIIRIASSQINLYTKQTFVPDTQDRYVDGEDSPYLYIDNFLPMIFVSRATVSRAQSTYRSRVSDNFYTSDRRVFGAFTQGFHLTSDNRVLEFINDFNQGVSSLFFSQGMEVNDPIWARGSRNIKLEGAFGWIVDLKPSLLTTTPIPLQLVVAVDTVNTNDYVEVNTVTGVDIGDVAIIKTANKDVYRRIWGIDDTVSPVRILVDKITSPAVVPATTEIDIYGKTPRPIVYATTLLVDSMRQGVIPKNPTQPIARAIYREKIDNYEWEADPGLMSSGINKDKLTLESTGVPMVDRILDEYTELPYVGFV